MQLIEKLKSASNQQETQGVDNLEFPNQINQTSPSFFETINNYPNKLRTNTSIPANLNKHIENQPINCQYLVQNNNNIQFASQIQLDPNIPVNKNVS